MKTRTPYATLLLALAALPAFAGIKYWDNPDYKNFDVDDYVQTDMLLHFDGIRNVGAEAGHDSAATTWANLGTAGSAQDAVWCSYIPVEGGSGYVGSNPNSSEGAWEKDGFRFNGKAYFAKLPGGTSFTRPASYTVQVALRGYPQVQSGNTCYPFWPGTGWDQGSVGIRKNNIGAATGPANSMYLTDKDPQTASYRANFVNSPTSYSYFTGIIDATGGYGYAFGTATKPVAGGSASAPALAGTAAADTIGHFAIGGFYGKSSGTAFGSLECFIGTIHDIRLYGRALTDEELAWNRVIDEARYFDRRAAIPVTNAVVASSVASVDGDQPCGAYAVDASGFTFTAPASKTVDGRAYTCTGCTVETWNGSAWGAPVTQNGVLSVPVSSSDRKRITWQYEADDGLANYGLVTYDVGDYVQDGLFVFYDGIRNVGADQPHSSGSMTWKNLGSAGATGDATVTGYSVDAGISGEWGENGYDCGGTMKINCPGPVTWGPTFTLQALVDTDSSKLKHATSANYILGVGWASCSLVAYKNNKNFQFHTQSASAYPYGPYAAVDTKWEYCTAMLDGDAKTASAFTGTAIPTEDGTDRLSYESMAGNVSGSFNIGSWGGGNSQYFVGRIKSIRAYNRILTEAELEQNRMVDEARFFGRIPVTNVVVQSTYSYLQGDQANGPYQVNGAYNFTAPATVTAPNGIEYACDGYIVETQDGIGWANATSGSGNSYLYNTSAGTVRLTWKWKATRGLRTATDYSVDDLSPAGLALHYDGLLNAGVGVARTTTATKWVNLGSRPGMDLTRATSGSDTSLHGAWGDKGYAFAGKAQFGSASGLAWPTTFSAQALVDAKYADNPHTSGHYIAATTWSQFGMQIDGKRNIGRFNAQGQESYDNRAHYATETGIDYMTAIHDAVTKTAVVFPGTSAPTGGTSADGYMHFDTFNGIENNQFRLGGWGGGAGSGQCLVGTLYTFRYYDRVITQEEIIRNRNVDAVRYFGALGVTNVIVAVEDGAGIVPAETAGEPYFVEGEYAFTAAGGAGLGYRVSVPDGNGGWRLVESVGEGTTYTYTSGTSPALVKLEWRIQKPFVLVVR